MEGVQAGNSQNIDSAETILYNSQSSKTEGTRIIQPADNIYYQLPGENSKFEQMEKETKRAQKKLCTACIFCVVFMVVEVVAGLLSNSLALLTDASHLLSDVCSFSISIFAIWVSRIQGNSKMSFGYHRAEILGALLSIILIWALTGWLVYAAIERLHQPIIVEGNIMLITAVVGTLVNLFITYILKVHSHGIGHVHNHDHPGVCDRNNSGAHVHGLPNSHEEHDHSNARDNCGKNYFKKILLWSRMKRLVDKRSESAGAFLDIPLEAATSFEDEEIDIACNNEASDVPINHFHSAGPSHEVKRTKLPDTIMKENVNLNLKAAYIHALGDLLQNVAVMVASFIIWIRPPWSIADPICTLLFSVFVLFTTFSILREAVNVLMEGTPIGVDLDLLLSDLKSVEGVCEVHDLHVWSLSVGKPALACHIVVDNALASDVLIATTSVCQLKYGILHTTIQTDFICKTEACDTYAHQKCSL